MANTAYSSLFSATGVPVAPNPYRVPAGGVQIVPISVTVPTTQIDGVGDFTAFWPIPSGCTPLGIIVQSATDMDTHATPTLDLDWVLRTIDKNGTVTDVQLVNGGTLYQAAASNVVYLFSGAATVLSSDADSIGMIGLYAVAAAATAAEGTVVAALIYR